MIRTLHKRSVSFDDNLTVLLADVHVGGLATDPCYQLQYIEVAVADILRMDPLPRRVFVFGDLAFLFGRKCDYEKSYPLMKLIRDAGIDLYITMGNHDHRGAFFEVYPEHAETTPVKGKAVSVVTMPDCDFILFDSLQENLSGAEADNPVPGELPEDEYEWLAQELPKRKKPFFLGCHHPLNEIKVLNGTGEKTLQGLFSKCPALSGYINGHNHRWDSEWGIRDWGDRRCVKRLILPSTGHWGDIGYTLFRTGPDGAVAEFVQRDFFFATPLKEGETRPPVWDAVYREHTGATCRFSYSNP